MGAGGHHNQGQGSSPDSLLQVQAGAVPALRDAFADALARVDRQLELADTELRITPWANDPVSTDATTRFNERSVDATESALDTLRAYRGQLSSAVDRLDRTAEQYRLSEQDNRITVGTEGQRR